MMIITAYLSGMVNRTAIKARMPVYGLESFIIQSRNEILQNVYLIYFKIGSKKNKNLSERSDGFFDIGLQMLKASCNCFYKVGYYARFK